MFVIRNYGQRVVINSEVLDGAVGFAASREEVTDLVEVLGFWKGLRETFRVRRRGRSRSDGEALLEGSHRTCTDTNDQSSPSMQDERII